MLVCASNIVAELVTIGKAWFDKLPLKQRKIGKWLIKQCHEDNESIKALTDNIKQKLEPHDE